MLVSERIGQFFVDAGSGRDRLEYTEYGAGDHWVVLLHGQLMPRRMHQPLARALAAEGLHVVTLDLLGHGRSDRPADPLVYSMTAFAEQVVALLDHLGALPRRSSAVRRSGRTCRSRSPSWRPEGCGGCWSRCRSSTTRWRPGSSPSRRLLFAARFLPFTVNGLACDSPGPIPRGLVPFWVGIALDTLDQRSESIAAVVHGLFFGRIAPPARRRREITAPALVVGHPADPIHPAADAAMLAEELPQRHVRPRPEHPRVARSAPERLNHEAAEFATRSGRSPADLGLASRLRKQSAGTRSVGSRRAAAGLSTGPGRIKGCLSTATRRSCCAPTSWARPTGSSPC